MLAFLKIVIVHEMLRGAISIRLPHFLVAAHQRYGLVCVRSDSRMHIIRHMLTRYTIIRGKRSPSDPLPDGVRQDTRRHTRHCLRPERAMVDRYLADPTNTAWEEFRQQYLALLDARFASDPEPFRALADLAAAQDVYLGCNCPTRTNPSVWHCHTVLALQFMKSRFPSLYIVLPPNPDP